MVKRTFVLFLLVLFVRVNILADMHTISSLPTTIDINDVTGSDPYRNWGDTFVFSASSLTERGSASAQLINITGLSGIVLMRDPARSSAPYDTLFFDSSDGIYVASSCDSVRIENIAVIRVGDADDSSFGSPTGWSGIILSSANSTIDSCYIYNNTSSLGYGVYLGGGEGIYNQLVTRTIIDMQGHWFVSRCQYDIAGIKAVNYILADTAQPDFQYHARVEYSRVVNSPLLGIVIGGVAVVPSGGSVCQVEGSYFQTDARNDRYLTYSGQCYSAANPYAILFHHVGGSSFPSYIKSCTTMAGSAAGGGRAMLIENTLHAPSNNPIEIKHNVSYVSEGPNVEFGADLPAYALRIRNDPGYLEVDSNALYVYTDTATATTYRGNIAAVVCLSAGEATNDPTAGHVTMRDNIAVNIAGDGCDEDRSYGIQLEDIYADSVYVLYNTTCTAATIIKLSGTNALGSQRQYFYGLDAGYPDSIANHVTFAVGQASLDSWYAEATVADISLPNAEDDTNIVFSPLGRSDQGVTLLRTLEIQVLDSAGIALDGASVWVVNNYGDTALSGTTAGGGIVSGYVKYWEEFRGLTDSTAFNDFTIKALYGTDSTSGSFTVTQLPAGGVDSLSLTGSGVDPNRGQRIRQKVIINKVVPR